MVYKMSKFVAIMALGASADKGNRIGVDSDGEASLIQDWPPAHHGKDPEHFPTTTTVCGVEVSHDTELQSYVFNFDVLCYFFQR